MLTEVLFILIFVSDKSWHMVFNSSLSFVVGVNIDAFLKIDLPT